MRKAQKKDILDMIQTLHEAHEEIKNHIDTNNTVSAQDLLAQCQECAVSIGNAIETMEKEDCVTIPCIQDYCDLVYQIYEALQSNTDSNANKIYKNLKKQLLRIENSVKNDIPVRKEVVFFPYKASMWDSLESVYLAAKEDPECDAYCVPIPYYDRNPDRSLGQMHYEGNEYPKNIEITDWQKYNFEERKPDVIYIHNPYDDWNLVTCVHPRYFSSNLKKYTEKLVYIPYFVLQEIEPDDQRTIDNMKHFIWTPGVINADKVIVQSEKMKQIYVNEYLKAAQENGLQGNHLDRKYLEEKFLGLGSPKIDKVLNTKKEDLEIPKEWLKIIQKPDGSWKKIIFYNTSIAALLENNEKMLEKMKDVFRIFKENKDEVALLWRPHPLIKSTVSSMRPQLWIEYEKLVKWYKEEGWGIYDDTSDMDRAVVISDGYYGDSSSVVKVYQETGKPVMIQNAKGSFLQKIDRPIVINNRMWFTNSDDAEIYEVNTITGIVEKVIENKEKSFRAIYGCCKYQNKLIFLPGLKQKITIIDIETGKDEYVNYPLNKMYWCDYYTNIVYKSQLFCFPLLANCIEIINMADFTIQKLDIFCPVENKKIQYIKRVVQINQKVFLPCENIPYILQFDLDSKQYKWISLEKNISCSGFIDIALFNEKVYLLSKENILLETVYNFEGTISILAHISKPCNYIIPTEEQVILLPQNGENIYSFKDRNIYEVEVKNIDYYNSKLKKQINFSDIAEDNNYIYAIPRCGIKCLKINKKNGNITELEIKCSDELFCFIKNKLKKDKLIEEGIFSLKNFIDKWQH